MIIILALSRGTHRIPSVSGAQHIDTSCHDITTTLRGNSGNMFLNRWNKGPARFRVGYWVSWHARDKRDGVDPRKRTGKWNRDPRATGHCCCNLSFFVNHVTWFSAVHSITATLLKFLTKYYRKIINRRVKRYYIYSFPRRNARICPLTGFYRPTNVQWYSLY